MLSTILKIANAYKEQVRLEKEFLKQDTYVELLKNMHYVYKKAISFAKERGLPEDQIKLPEEYFEVNNLIDQEAAHNLLYLYHQGEFRTFENALTSNRPTYDSLWEQKLQIRAKLEIGEILEDIDAISRFDIGHNQLAIYDPTTSPTELGSGNDQLYTQGIDPHFYHLLS